MWCILVSLLFTVLFYSFPLIFANITNIIFMIIIFLIITTKARCFHSLTLYSLQICFWCDNNFFPTVETPGMAFYTSIVPDAGNAIGDAVSNGWPALVFVIMSAMIAGMIYWLSVSDFYLHRLRKIFCLLWSSNSPFPFFNLFRTTSNLSILISVRLLSLIQLKHLNLLIHIFLPGFL